MKFRQENLYQKINFKKFFKIVFGVLAGYLLCLILIILALRWVNPPFTAFTIQEDWEELGAERYNLRDYWVNEQDIPDHVKLATISSEDQRFESHWGLDFEAIKIAYENYVNGGERRGASTISQQVSKNLFLTPAQTYFRKGVEAGITIIIELLWSKERILEMYLNIAEFGPAIYGIGKASEELYDKEVSDITPYEAARLASVLPSPKRLSVQPASPFVQERTQWILLQMTYLSDRSYLPKPEPIPDMITADSEPEVDSSYIQEDQPQIGRAKIPDSLIQINDTDPLLDTAWSDSLNAWRVNEGTY